MENLALNPSLYNKIELNIFNFDSSDLADEAFQKKIPDIEIGFSKIGDIRVSGSIVKKNCITFCKTYDFNIYLDDSLTDYFSDIYYKHNLEKLNKKLKPEYSFIRMIMPMRSGDIVCSFGIESKNIIELAKNDLGLDFWFYEWQ
jgi:hypothetical protein